MNEQDFIDTATAYTRQQFTMTPEKFGYIGGYCSATLKAEPAEYRTQMIGQQMTKFVMQVMSGRTVSEHPEVTLTWLEFATWWDHVKQAIWDWRDELNVRWETEPPPWMVLLWPFLVLFPKWARRHPVNKTPKLARTTVNFKQSVLYPEMDHIPPDFGHPVVYETMTLHPECLPGGSAFGINSGPSRFMDKHEITREIMRLCDEDTYPSGPYYAGHPITVLNALERLGVNVDQLVKRR